MEISWIREWSNMTDMNHMGSTDNHTFGFLLEILLINESCHFINWIILLVILKEITFIRYYRNSPGKFTRAYFRKIKHLGIGRFVKKWPFWKKIFLNLNQKCQKQFQFRGYNLQLPFWIIQAPFCQTKVLLYWNEKPFSKNDLTQSFNLSTQFLNFQYFRLKYF